MRHFPRFPVPARLLMTRHAVAALVAVACLPLGGCEYLKGPLHPTEEKGSTPNGPPSSGGITTGQTTNAVDGAPLRGITFRANSGASAVSDGNGRFEIQATGGRQTAVLSGSGFVERQTGVTMPGPHAVLSLIPTSFDLRAFDQMFRTSGARLQRWVKRPSLVIQTRTLAFTSARDTDFTAMNEELSAGEVADLVADFRDGLRHLGAGRLDFASIDVESAGPGSRVSVARTNRIFVARYSGLQQSGYVGFGRWATSNDASVVAGSIFLDRDWDKRPGLYRQATRMHELGHGLGYNHVTGRTSVMNPAPKTLPTTFDKEAAAIAFQRQPGNRAPDVDVASYSANITSPGFSTSIIWEVGLGSTKPADAK